MALIKCKECGNEVSNTAQTCPKCGARVAPKPLGCGSVVFIIFMVGVIASSILPKFRSDTSSPATLSTPELAIETTAPKCNRASAEKVQSLLRDMATWQERNGVVTFKWGPGWDEAAPHERVGLVRSFADSDACLTGQAREINFYRMGKRVATASPSSGIRLVD